MVLYIVLEEDRGAGVMPVGVFSDRQRAEDVADMSSHYFLDEIDSDDPDQFIEIS